MPVLAPSARFFGCFFEERCVDDLLENLWSAMGEVRLDILLELPTERSSETIPQALVIPASLLL
jgi:hypothetical protein